MLREARRTVKVQAKIKSQHKKTEVAKKQTEKDINPDLIIIGSGSGFYINNKGYALTNSHVVEICEQVITIVGGQKILFHIIAENPKSARKPGSDKNSSR